MRNRNTGGKSNSEELDVSWNPRNKHLADARFVTDIASYGCQQAEGLYAGVICSIDYLFWEQAGVMHWFVNKWNDKGWPVTDHDIAGTMSKGRTGFVSCLIPTISIDKFNNDGGDTITVEWTYDSGCVTENTVDHYRSCWDAAGTYKVRTPRAIQVRQLREGWEEIEGDLVATFYQIPDNAIWDFVTLVTTEIRPNDIKYGGVKGFESLGSYFPEQEENLTLPNLPGWSILD